MILQFKKKQVSPSLKFPLFLLDSGFHHSDDSAKRVKNIKAAGLNSITATTIQVS
jgi:hypothetical protein